MLSQKKGENISFPRTTFLSPKDRDVLWHKKYCEWKWGEMLDYKGNDIKCEMTTDCGHKIIYTKYNRYGKLLEQEDATCPFCDKKLTICCYE